MRALSLFSGIGLHDLGLERAGWEIAGQVENDPWCSAVLARHWPGVPRWGDVRDVTAESIRERAGAIDLITGGFPCTDISLAGKGAGLSGEQSGLWREMLRIIRGVSSAWCFIENVPALRLRGAQQVVSDLEESGYTVLPPVVVGAWATGAPHRRDRVWIVARLVANTQNRGREAEGQRGREAEEPELGCHGAEWGAGMADAGRNGVQQLQQREPAGREAGSLRDGGEAEPGGLRSGGMADANGAGLAKHGGEPGDSREERAAAVGSGGVGLADADSIRREQFGRGGILDGERATPGGDPDRRDGWPAWPAGRGEPQYSWEPSRLTQPRMGGGAHGRASRLDSFARRNRLRALGNANPPDIPELIGRWILAQEGAS